MSDAAWYTCGTCRYALLAVIEQKCVWEEYDQEGRPLYRPDDYSCPRWLPPRDAWKTRMCGTCEFEDEDSRCRRFPDNEGYVRRSCH